MIQYYRAVDASPASACARIITLLSAATLVRQHHAALLANLVVQLERMLHAMANLGITVALEAT